MSTHAELQNYWDVNGETLAFAHPTCSFRAEVPRGFVSWQIGGDELLHGESPRGGIFYRQGEAEVSGPWSEVGNLSHDAMLGRQGAIHNGLFKAQIITGWTLPRFTLYAGYNLTDDLDLVLLLGDEVQVVRLGDPDRDRTHARQLVNHQSKQLMDAPNGCVVVHRSGRALSVYAACRVGPVTTPAGEQRLALVFPVKGHAANELLFQAEPRVRSGNLTVFPKLQVDASNAERPYGGHWGLYEPETGLTYSLTFGWLGNDAFGGSWEVEFRHALGGRDFHAREAITEADRHGDRYTVSLSPKPQRPGVSDVWVRLLDADGSVLFVDRFRAMYDWRNYRPAYHQPDDLRAFWDQTLAELREVPLEPTTERVFEDHPEWKLYNVAYNGWQGQRIHALLYVPKEGDGPFPTIIGSHPGTAGWNLERNAQGLYGSKVKAQPGFVTLRPLIRGHLPDATDIPFNQPWWGPLDSRDDYAARGWYTAMARGIDYLASRPDLADLDRLVAAGGSQGGALALATAALDPRVDWCFADSPSNAMLHDSMEPGTYSSFGPTIGQIPEGQSFADLKKTLSYYDPAHLASFITAPTVIGVTIGDLTVHSMGGLGIYHNLTALPAEQKWFLPGVNGHFHSNSRAAGALQKRILDALRQGLSPNPQEPQP